MEKKIIKNQTIKKIQVSDEVSNFIKLYNCISIHSKKYKSTSTIYWNDCKYIETEDPNVFEVIFETDIISDFLDNRRRFLDETTDNT